MIRINLLLDEAKGEANITPTHVWNEIERISVATGRDFKRFFHEEDNQIYVEAPENMFSPSNWSLIPAYGNNRNWNPDSPEGFALFFLVTTTLPLAEHQRDWAEECWTAWDEGLSPIVIASRSFGKTIFTRSIQAYHIGLFPSGECGLVRATDLAARGAIEPIASIIKNNSGWKLMFAHIVPNEEKGQAGSKWSATAGYDVIDLLKPAEEWMSMLAIRTSASLLKYGVRSGSLLGGRITNLGVVDDLHSDQDPITTTELLVSRYQKAITPMYKPGSRELIVGTPWHELDILHVLPPTGLYNVIRTPITKEGTWPGTPAWPELFDVDAIQAIYDRDTTPNKRDFAMNRLLTLLSAFQRHFTYRTTKKYEPYWYHRIGIDYAAGEGVGPERSYFALSVAAQEPESGAWVVMDGVVARVTQSQAERLLLDFHNKYKNIEVVTYEEAQGGKEYAHNVARMANFEINLIGVSPDSRSKEARWEFDLEPAFAGERMLLLDPDEAKKPDQAVFLTEIQHALNRYPNFGKRGDKAADILDSLYYLIYFYIVAHADPVRQTKKKSKKDNPYHMLIETRL